MSLFDFIFKLSSDDVKSANTSFWFRRRVRWLCLSVQEVDGVKPGDRTCDLVAGLSPVGSL